MLTENDLKEIKHLAQFLADEELVDYHKGEYELNYKRIATSMYAYKDLKERCEYYYLKRGVDLSRFSSGADAGVRITDRAHLGRVCEALSDEIDRDGNLRDVKLAAGFFYSIHTYFLEQEYKQGLSKAILDAED